MAQQPINLLLVEDSGFEAEMIQQFIKNQNHHPFQTIWADSFAKAKELLTKQNIDVVLLDLHLPDSVGLQTYYNLQTEAPNTAVVILSGGGDHKLALETVREGAQDYLVKGQINQDNIIRALRYAIERQKAQLALKESEISFRTLCETITAATLIFSNNQIKYVNPATELITEYSREELYQLTPQQLLYAKNQEEFNRLLVKLVRQEKVEMRILQKSRHERWMEFTMRPITFQGVPAQLVTAFDITSHKKTMQYLEHAKEVAEQAHQAKSSFLANISHELRTPLNTIMGYVELLQDIVQDNGHYHYLTDLNSIQSSAFQLLEIINSVLLMTKIESGNIKLAITKFSIKEMVHDITEMITPLVENNGNTLKVVCSDDGTIQTDELKLRQILFHVLNNAAKFTMNGQITFSCTQKHNSPKSYIFSIEDTGIGMSPKQIEDALKPFQQVDDSATRVYGGVGLGLTISNYLCQLLEGNISIQSKEQKGTTVTLSFPDQLQTT